MPLLVNPKRKKLMLLHHHFIKISKKYSNKPALVDITSNKTFSYSKILVGSIILSRKFMKLEKGFIGIMLPTSAGCALSVLGAVMSGRIPVMINYSTGAASNARYAQKKCNFTTIITSRILLGKIQCPYIQGMIFIEDVLKEVSGIDKIKAAILSKLPVPVISKFIHGGNEDDDLVVLFTSGSEKEPKAVEITHCTVTSMIKNLNKIVDLSNEDRMLANLPFFHVFGLMVNLWVALYHGMTIVLYSNPIDYKKICTIAREQRPTIMVGSPNFLWGYLRKSEPGDFSSLRFVVNGADKCPEALRQEFLQTHGITVLEGYGTTEVPIISVNTNKYNRPGSVGKPLPDIHLRIENFDTGNECNFGDTGKIMVKGDLVMKGYFDPLQGTPISVRGGWYDTGDMGYLDRDGFLWHAGRLKRFVKIGGEMISLATVEAVLESCIPEGVSCCAVEIPDALKGAKIVAVVTEQVDEKTILRQMAEHLPAIALPKQIMVVNELPIMGTGKINFRAVTEMVYAIFPRTS
jgi:acyl-[acyl-carrier-protein]-phospholipid O-acyltransferase / long-chain-fatty-acid--[acyl-carrier-protein] ligase